MSCTSMRPALTVIAVSERPGSTEVKGFTYHYRNLESLRERRLALLYTELSQTVSKTRDTLSYISHPIS